MFEPVDSIVIQQPYTNKMAQSKNVNTFEIAESLPIGVGGGARGGFGGGFGDRNNFLRPENNSKTLLNSKSVLNTDSIPGKLKHLRDLYNYNSVFELERVKEETKQFFAAYKIKKEDEEDMPGIFPKSEIQDKPHSKTREQKDFKSFVSKIMRVNGKITLVITDVINKNSKNVNLEAYYNEMPCKNHVQGRLSGHFFIYDNKGRISVFIGHISGKFYENDRKICDLRLDDDRIDPTLFLIERSSENCILLVVGGHVQMENSNQVVPMDEISVFEFNMNGTQKRIPLFKIKLKYPRMYPIVFDYRDKDEKFIFILGGNNPRRLGKKNLLGIDMEKFLSANEIIEALSFKKLQDTLFKINFNNINSIPMEFSLRILCDKNLKTVLPTMTEAGVARHLRGVLSEKGKNTTYIIGVGYNKNTIMYIDYLEKNAFTIHINYGFKKNLGSAMLCNQMLTIHESNLCYFSDDLDPRIKTVQFQQEHKSSCPSCNIF